MYLSLISEALKTGNTPEVRRLTMEALEAGYLPDKILNKALITAMNEVGDKFKDSEIFIPEVLKASRAMHGGLRILQNRVEGRNPANRSGRVLIGTVAGDLHDIGKYLVSMFMDAGGFEVINLGIDVPTDDFVWAVRKHKPQVLAMSALLTTTMPAMQDTINAIKKSGLREKVKILVGGGPVTRKFAEEIGADGYAYDAPSAVKWLVENIEV